MIDQINHNKKKRYELRHIIEQEYRERDIEDQERAKERKNNFVKYDELMKKYDKGIRLCHQKSSISSRYRSRRWKQLSSNFQVRDLKTPGKRWNLQGPSSQSIKLMMLSFIMRYSGLYNLGRLRSC
jgi:DNA-binding protein H-NS